MSKVYLHSKSNKYSLIKILLFLLVPFLLYGFYKNGIFLYQKGYTSVFGMFKPLIFTTLSIVTSLVFNKYFDKEYGEYRLFLNVIISLVSPYNIDVLVFLVILIVLNIIYKFFKINIIPIYMIIVFLMDLLFKDHSFLNPFEISVQTNYNFIDILLGKGIGGISNTLIVFSFISLIVLISNSCFKKHVSICGLASFYILVIIYFFIKKEIDINLLLNSNIIFSYIFIFPISIYSPYSKGAMILLGIISGVLSFLFYLIFNSSGVYFVILIAYFMTPFLDKLIVKKSNNKLIDTL